MAGIGVFIFIAAIVVWGFWIFEGGTKEGVGVLSVMGAIGAFALLLIVLAFAFGALVAGF